MMRIFRDDPLCPSHLTLQISFPFYMFQLNFSVNKQRLQDDATRSMEIHNNPVTMIFNIDIQISVTFKYYK